MNALPSTAVVHPNPQFGGLLQILWSTSTGENNSGNRGGEKSA